MSEPTGDSEYRAVARIDDSSAFYGPTAKWLDGIDWLTDPDLDDGVVLYVQVKATGGTPGTPYRVLRHGDRILVAHIPSGNVIAECPDKVAAEGIVSIGNKAHAERVALLAADRENGSPS